MDKYTHVSLFERFEHVQISHTEALCSTWGRYLHGEIESVFAGGRESSRSVWKVAQGITLEGHMVRGLFHVADGHG